MGGKKLAKTHCAKGHLYTPETTIYGRRKRDGVYVEFRQCKICRDVAKAEWSERERKLQQDGMHIMRCPLCGRETHHRADARHPDIPRAVLANGTCDPCWRTKIRAGHGGRKTDRHVSNDDKSFIYRRDLELYFMNRRKRGIAPEGNALLDAAYDEDKTWPKRDLAARRAAQAKERERNVAQIPKAMWRRVLDRDGGHCVHCGGTERLVPQHRKNRGMGGSKQLETPSNVIVVCSAVNGHMEANAYWAERARYYGWKLRPGQDPATTPYYDCASAEWYLPDEDCNRVVVESPHSVTAPVIRRYPRKPQEEQTA